MPTYDYGCATHGTFEAQGGLNDSFVPCPACHEPSRRRPFSGVPALRGETVPTRQIPDKSYAWDKAERDHRKTGWDLDRAVNTLRDARREDKEGRISLDMRKLSNA